jgi:hypothetical protein
VSKKHNEPHPLRDMIKEDYLALPDKMVDNWRVHSADSNEKATTLIRRYVNETTQSEFGRLSNAKMGSSRTDLSTEYCSLL